ncbi:MAG: NfeD family protein [Candidatus Sulfobium sp.]|jgi:membrane protein implicated in regulation of membrane protease activity
MVLMPLLMFLPLLALPIFWLLPLAEALPIYLCLVALSAAMMWVMRKTMKMPSRTGAEYLVGREAKVVSRSGPGYGTQYQVRVDGELWSARSSDALAPGDSVTVAEIKSNVLIVERKSKSHSHD